GPAEIHGGDLHPGRGIGRRSGGRGLRGPGPVPDRPVTRGHGTRRRMPGFLIALFTFPGVVVHELAHCLVCRWTEARGLRGCYFRFGNPAGFVVHEKPTSVWKSILIGVGPLFVNTVAGFAIALLAIACYRWGQPGGQARPWLFAALMWLAISVAMHSFPSTGD